MIRHALRFACALALGAAARGAHGFPLDAAEQTGIVRLEAYRLAQSGKVRGRLLPPGARLGIDEIRLRLLDRPDFEIPEPDAKLGAALRSLLGDDADAYALALLDLTDPDTPRYAAHNSEQPQNPGSVGKLMVALAWFQALADVYADDPAARDALLKNTEHVADAFIRHDAHTVPFWHPGDTEIEYRPIREGDRANLWTWLDWMMSSSSNAAGSTIMSQLVLLSRFGSDYPPPREVAERFFRETPKPVLTRIYTDAIQQPIRRNGLDLERLRQGSFFTKEGQARIPGGTSTATARELLRYMVQLEKGRLVDAHASLAIKRLLYLSEGRIRYAASPALRRAALYFKSGSLYDCKPEAGFTCGKYKGNVRNYLNSVTGVETDEPGRRLHYIVVLLSNVLRRNSAELHEQLATAIHEMMERDHPPRDAPGERAPALDDGSDEAAIQRAIERIRAGELDAPTEPEAAEPRH
ncbi:MAG TPA: hypothetical protein VEC18_02060 [Myxococcota bacterium]|nr:hypothetical protein [Myxococcota bacterium]